MRRVFQNPPSEKAVRREVKALAKRYGLPAPRVEFWEQGNAVCDYSVPGGGVLRLPQPEWAWEHQPDLKPETYWLLVAHEAAHYIAASLQRTGPSHNNVMYTVLLAVVAVWSLPLSSMYFEERDYLPAALERGMRAAGEIIEAALIDATTSVPSVAPSLAAGPPLP